MMSPITHDIIDPHIKDTHMHKMKTFTLKCRGVGGHDIKNRENQPNFSLVKVYLSNHAITNNLNKENGICMKSLLILKEANIIVLHSIVKMVEKLLEVFLVLYIGRS